MGEGEEKVVENIRNVEKEGRKVSKMADERYREWRRMEERSSTVIPQVGVPVLGESGHYHWRH